MFNNSQRKGLKAWIRFDGNKNAVAGSLIFQKSKPKVGNWKEYMDVNLCCPSTPGKTCNTSNLNIEQFLSSMNTCYEQVTSLFPNIVYFTDYGESTYINNGCDDMYDSGNSFNTDLTQTYNTARQNGLNFDDSIPYTHTQDNGDADSCNYTNPPMDGQIVSGTGYFNTATCSKYFTNMYPGMFVLAATGMNVAQFGIYGDLGSDGSGTNEVYQELTDYPGWSIFLKTNYDESDNDPSVTHIILLYGSLDNVVHAFDFTGTYDDDAIIGLGSPNTAVISLTMASEATENVIDIETAIQIANKVLTIATEGCPLPALRLLFDNIENVNLVIGDASNVNDWNTYFDLPAYGSPFTSVIVVGNEVQLLGGSNIVIKQSLFDQIDDLGTSLLEVNDEAGVVIEMEYGAFGYDTYNGCPNLTSVNLPNVTIAGDGVFLDCGSLVSINLPNLIVAGNFCFSGCDSLTTIELPNLTTAGSTFFIYCNSLTTINLPSCTNLGGTVGDDGVFLYITGNNITLTVPSALMTCDAGNPDGDIVYLQANNTVTVITV